MSKYSDIAILSVELLQIGKVRCPKKAWGECAFKFYPDSKASREKNCPKSVFLGLCEEGKVKWCKAGSYTRSKENKRYALKALRLIKENPQINEVELWNKISNKKYNQQMHVVLALFRKGLIVF